MRCPILGTIAILICLTTSMLAAQPHESRKGDVNNDGNINVLDMLAIANHVLGIATLDQQGLWRADLNGPVEDCDGDGSANVLDMVKIANIILGSDACPATTLTDIDGNVYQTVTIGSQVWMAENLKVTHYRNGNPISEVTSNMKWSGLSSGAYCNYDNDAGNVGTYGRLYNWYATVDSQNISPAGWHVPSDDEWKQLEIYLGMSQSQADATGLRGTIEGGKMKEAGYSHWSSPNSGATNTSGFSALPGGIRYGLGSFFGLGEYAYFWSSTEIDYDLAWTRSLGYSGPEVYRAGYDKQQGFSVRCVRDNVRLE